MIIGSLIEDDNSEKRIAITLEVLKKYISNGFSVKVERDFGNYSNISDEEFKKAGAEISNMVEEIIKNLD
jgi:hypothetical protein